MFVHNIRYGVATNSSSTHSVVILPKKHTFVPKNSSHDEYSYGWEYFVCDTEESKMRYLAAQMFAALDRSFSGYDEVDRTNLVEMIHGWTGVDLTPVLEKYYKKNKKRDSDGDLSYVFDIGADHQSAAGFHRFIWTDEVRDHFFKDLVEYMKNDRLVILGGSDNSDFSWSLPKGSKDVTSTVLVDKDCSSEPCVKVKRNGKTYTLFNINNGNKVRVSLVHGNVTSIKSDTPDLVDMKITNYCPYGCSFCYQNSTIQGKHANIDDIKQYIDVMSKMVVFEVAIGGGEPTYHPQFTDILDYCTEKNVRPNFTTYSTEWLNDEKNIESVRKNCGGIGVSVHSLKDMEKVERIAFAINGVDNSNDPIYNISEYSSSKTRMVMIMAQHVLGSSPIDETFSIISECWGKGIPILLLGYKTTGRGKEGTKYDYSDLPLMLKLRFSARDIGYNVKTSVFSIDTAIVDNFKKLLTDLCIHEVLVSSPEGKFSCYIDAVKNMMGKSSYCGQRSMKNITPDYNQIHDLYLTY